MLSYKFNSAGIHLLFQNTRQNSMLRDN